MPSPERFAGRGRVVVAVTLGAEVNDLLLASFAGFDDTLLAGDP